MLRFENLFIIQIIGLLINRKFSGDCHIRIDSLPAHLQFSGGTLIDASYQDLVRADALEKILWTCKGGIELSPMPYPETGWNYIPDMDRSIAKSSLSMPDDCPFMKNLFLERSKVGLQDKSTFMEIGQLIYNRVRSGISTNIIEAQKGILPSDFWGSLFHLMGTGQIMGDYGQNLSVLLLKVQGHIVNNLQKMLGKRVAELYQDRLSQEMDRQWPNFPAHKNYDRIYGAYDRIYGTAPYQTWAKLLGEAVAKAASTAMGHSCYKKALASLKLEENDLLQQLLD
ncbi:MAG: hypothetical protein H6974_07930 [Gammaproteobacteria bacterium]|nr:hypothetical protein [Gammaproteobacteria bacterium]MCP5196699.1 hypothetical protein [Gammaproteobacteria bacterium]